MSIFVQFGLDQSSKPPAVYMDFVQRALKNTNIFLTDTAVVLKDVHKGDSCMTQQKLQNPSLRPAGQVGLTYY
jgi:hypothetical protein